MKYVPKELKDTGDISQGREALWKRVGNVIFVVLFFVILYVLLGVGADMLAVRVADEKEAAWFASWTRHGEAGSGEAFEKAQAIFDRMTRRPGLRALPYKLFVLEGLREPNAVAVPGGGIGVTDGLLEEVTTERALALVLAHEVGHHQHRHVLRRLGRTLLVDAGLAVVGGGSGSSPVSSVLALAESSYSREQEREADRFGMRMVRDLYGTTEGALEFFELMQEKSDQDRSRWRTFFRSHPLTSERLEYLLELQKELAGEAR